MKTSFRIVMWFVAVTWCGIQTVSAETGKATHEKQSIQHQTKLGDLARKASGKGHRRGHKRVLPNGVLSLDVFQDQDRIHVLMGQHLSGDFSLWHKVSKDDGRTWSEPVEVTKDYDAVPNLHRGNDARLAAQGEALFAVWMTRVEGVPHNAGPMGAAVSKDGGKTWRAGIQPTDWPKGPHAFISATANEEAMHLVWLDSRSDPKKKALLYSRSTDGGSTWSANTTLEDQTCFCCWNTAKADAEGKLYALYRDRNPSDMGLVTFSPRQEKAQRVSTVGEFEWFFDGCPHIGGGLDVKGTGPDAVLHAVVGTGHPDKMGVYYVGSTDAGKRWTCPYQLGDETALHSDIAVRDDGHLLAVWDMTSDEGMAVFKAESLDGGNSWIETQRLSKSGVRATHPRVVTTKNGFLTLWTENDSTKTQRLAIQHLDARIQ